MIHCKNLSKTFRNARVLAGIDLEIALGEPGMRAWGANKLGVSGTAH